MRQSSLSVFRCIRRLQASARRQKLILRESQHPGDGHAGGVTPAGGPRPDVQHPEMVQIESVAVRGREPQGQRRMPGGGGRSSWHGAEAVTPSLGVGTASRETPGPKGGPPDVSGHLSRLEQGLSPAALHRGPRAAGAGSGCWSPAPWSPCPQQQPGRTGAQPALVKHNLARASWRAGTCWLP